MVVEPGQDFGVGVVSESSVGEVGLLGPGTLVSLRVSALVGWSEGVDIGGDDAGQRCEAMPEGSDGRPVVCEALG